MGLFSNLLGGNSTPEFFNKQEAFVGLILAVVAADGHISDEEFNDIYSLTKKAKIMSGVSNDQFSAMINKVVKVVRKDGLDMLVDLSVAGLPSDFQGSVFAIACDLACSDGFIEKEEEQLLEKLKVKLAISDSMAQKIIEVITVKNRI